MAVCIVCTAAFLTRYFVCWHRSSRAVCVLAPLPVIALHSPPSAVMHTDWPGFTAPFGPASPPLAFLVGWLRVCYTRVLFGVSLDVANYVCTCVVGPYPSCYHVLCKIYAALTPHPYRIHVVTMSCLMSTSTHAVFMPRYSSLTHVMSDIAFLDISRHLP